jgi:putative lipoprotein
MKTLVTNAITAIVLAALLAANTADVSAQAGPPVAPNEGSVQNGVYTHPGAGFQFTLPQSWLAYGYKWYESKGEAAVLQYPQSQYVVDWVYVPKDPAVAQHSLLRFVVYNRADWVSISAEPGPPVGDLVGQNATYSYIAVFPQSNPYEPGTTDAANFDNLVVSREYVHGAFQVLPASQTVQPVGAVAERCQWAGTGATFTVQGQRVNFTCASNNVNAVLYGDIAAAPTGWTIGRAVIVQDQGQLVPASTGVVDVLGIELADGMRCSWTGGGAPKLTDGRSAPFTCASNGRIYALTGDVQKLPGGWAIQRVELILSLTGFGAGATDLPFIAALGVGAPRTGTPAPPQRNNDLTGSSWNWTGTTSAVGERVEPNRPASYQLNFLPAGQFSIKADCNVGNGVYITNGSQITMTIGPMTLAACPPDSLSDEFIRQINLASYYTKENGQLLIQLAGNVGTMSFVASTAVTGTITYRERIALPDDAMVHAQLLDVSRADAPSAVISDQTIETNGKQVPFEFFLPYSSTDISESGQYSVRAEIRASDGRILFTTDTAVPVITKGRPTQVDLVLVQAG